ncbi:hypothetical protein EDB19DRAFT_747951 [Suillus lakei]|nr:hypothetical protein EDB19DRAFT_747951 [Suillus lakei]
MKFEGVKSKALASGSISHANIGRRWRTVTYFPSIKKGLADGRFYFSVSPLSVFNLLRRSRASLPQISSMAPFDSQPIKSLPTPKAGSIVARSYQSGSMDHHTIVDVVVIIVIFVALILSLSALAWFRPTLSSIHAFPVHGTSVPVTHTATPVRPTMTPGRSIHYSRQILVTSFSLLQTWWARASHNGTPRSATGIVHHEPTLYRGAQLPAHASSAGIGTEPYTRSPSFTTFAPTSISGAPSIVNTYVDSEAVELHMLGGSKAPSTSSFAVTDNVADTTDSPVVVILSAPEPAAHVFVGPASGASDPPSTTDLPLGRS